MFNNSDGTRDAIEALIIERDNLLDWILVNGKHNHETCMRHFFKDAKCTCGLETLQKRAIKRQDQKGHGKRR